MSYLIQSQIAADHNIQQRVTACAASLGIKNPQAWAYDHQWELSTQPGWTAAYANTGSGSPGADEGAITDGMILDAVEALKSDSGPLPASEEPQDPEEEG